MVAGSGTATAFGPVVKDPKVISPKLRVVRTDPGLYVPISPYRWLACLGISSQAWMASAGGRLWRSPRGQSSVTRRKAWGRDDFADSTDAQVDDPSAGG
jgi:hypothetical protein